MYQPTEDLNWHWLGGDDGSGPAPPCAVSATFVQNHENNVLTEPGGGHHSQIQTQGHVNGNGTTDSCYYDAYQYPYNYVAPIEAQYVGTVIHGSGGDPTQNVIRINPGPVPVTNGGSSPSIFDLSTQVVPVSISAVEPDSASLLDLSNLTSSSSIMDLSNHIAAYLQDGEDDTGRNEAQSGTYTMATLPAGAGTTPTPGFSQADGELRILKTENRFAVDGFIPTVSTPTKSSNGYVFARKSTPSPGNGFSVNADIDDEDEDDEEEDDWEEQNDREHEQQSRHRRRMQRLHPNARVTQIQNQRNAQHPNARPCEICGNLFRGKLVLRRHQIVIHGMKLPNWEQVLAAEERNNAKVPCGVCGKEVSKRSLNIHMTQVHGGGRVAPASGRRFKKAKKIGRPRKAPPVLEPQAHAHRQMLTPMPTSSSSSSTNKIDYSYLLLPRYQPFVPVERFTNIAKAVARYEQYVAARITKKRRSSSFDSAAWKKSLPSATCNLCGNVFRHKYTLRVHQAKVHKLPVPRLYTKRTPTPSPVKISGQAHAPPPPPNVVRALFRSATATASGSNTSAPPTLERNMDPLPLGESLSPAMPCLTPAATTAALTAATRPRPRPVSRQLALSRAAEPKPAAEAAPSHSQATRPTFARKPCPASRVKFVEAQARLASRKAQRPQTQTVGSEIKNTPAPAATSSPSPSPPTLVPATAAGNATLPTRSSARQLHRRQCQDSAHRLQYLLKKQFIS